jgi:hypothetical protein
LRQMYPQFQPYSDEQIKEAMLDKSTPAWSNDDSAIMALSETGNVTNCQLVNTGEVSKGETITYSVVPTDNGGYYVTLKSVDVSIDEVRKAFKAGGAVVEDRMAPQKAAQEAKDKAAQTLDASASCADGVDTLRLNMGMLVPTDIATISPGVCSAYVMSCGANPYSFAKVSYRMTLGGAKIIRQDHDWVRAPLAGQSVPEGVKHNSGGYYSDKDLDLALCPATGSRAIGTAIGEGETAIEHLRGGINNADGSPRVTGGAPVPPIPPKPRIQTNDPAGLY